MFPFYHSIICISKSRVYAKTCNMGQISVARVTDKIRREKNAQDTKTKQKTRHLKIMIKA